MYNILSPAITGVRFNSHSDHILFYQTLVVNNSNLCKKRQFLRSAACRHLLADCLTRLLSPPGSTSYWDSNKQTNGTLYRLKLYQKLRVVSSINLSCLKDQAFTLD